MQQLVIVGGGFAGLWAAMSAAAARHRSGAASGDLTITMINPEPDLINRPRLYEGAKDEIRIPMMPLLDEIGVRLVTGKAAAIRSGDQMVSLETGDAVAFDRLIVAAGSRLQRPDVPGAWDHGFSVDTFAETAALDAHLAQLAADATVAVIGASFTGLETVTELRNRLGPASRLLLLDQAEVLAPELGAGIRPVAEAALDEAGVEARLGVQVRAIDAAGIDLADGSRLAADAVIFATGFRASPLTEDIDGSRDPQGRLIVDPYLRVEGQPHVFACGDAAHAMTDDTHPALMSCQHAMPMGRHTGHNAVRDLLGEPMTIYRQEVYVTCLDLGPAGAVFTRGWDRRVEMTGAEAKTLKRQIMEDRIAPPDPGLGAEAIFAEFGLAPEA